MKHKIIVLFCIIGVLTCGESHIVDTGEYVENDTYMAFRSKVTCFSQKNNSRITLPRFTAIEAIHKGSGGDKWIESREHNCLINIDTLRRTPFPENNRLLEGKLGRYFTKENERKEYLFISAYGFSHGTPTEAMPYSHGNFIEVKKMDHNKMKFKLYGYKSETLIDMGLNEEDEMKYYVLEAVISVSGDVIEYKGKKFYRE